MTSVKSALAALVAAGALLTACGNTGTKESAVSVTRSDNIQVCRNYLSQRSWVKHLTQPNLTDAVRFETDVAVDESNAAPGTPLFRDLTTMETYQSEEQSVQVVSLHVLNDCAALGVTP